MKGWKNDEGEALLAAMVGNAEKELMNDRLISDRLYVKSKWLMILISDTGIVLASLLGFFIS